MAHIKWISFDRVDTMHGCICDRCGQWIKNIWTVTFDDNIEFSYGIDCFERLMKSSRLTDYGMKLMKKTMKSIKEYEEWMDREKEKTEETDLGWQNHQRDSNSYWYGKPYVEYKAWMIEEFLPSMIDKKLNELEKFKNVDFEI